MIKVLLADDHEMVLEGFASLLDRQPDIQVVGRARNGHEVIVALDQLEVDVAVLDVDMPGMDGLEATKVIVEERPEIKILALTMHNKHSYISHLVQLGAHGYILKNKGSDELVEAIHYVSRGKKYFGHEVTETLVNGIKEAAPAKKEEEIRLTKREKEVLKLIAHGMSTPQIAEKLFIANSTVETHRRNLIDKTGVENSKALIRWAIQHHYSD